MIQNKFHKEILEEIQKLPRRSEKNIELAKRYVGTDLEFLSIRASDL